MFELAIESVISRRAFAFPWMVSTYGGIGGGCCKDLLLVLLLGFSSVGHGIAPMRVAKCLKASVPIYGRSVPILCRNLPSPEISCIKFPIMMVLYCVNVD